VRSGTLSPRKPAGAELFLTKLTKNRQAQAWPDREVQRRHFLERAGGWNSKYFMTMDFDLWVRLAKLSLPKMVDRNFAYFRIHAHQKTSLANVRLQTKEIIEILEREQVTWGIRAHLRLKKWRHLIKGYVKTCLVSHGLLNSKYLHQPMRAKSRT